jgi:hypothetical protein
MPVNKPVWERYLDASIDGAKHNREHQKLLAAQSKAPLYAAAAPNVMDREPAKDIFLGRYALMGMESLYGRNFKFFPQYQEWGTCVGQSHAFLSTITVGVSSLLSGLRFPGRIAVAPIYAGSRVEIGKNPGTWEGSVGSWAAQWLTKYGCVTYRELGHDDNPKDDKAWLKTMKADETQAMKWTASRDGVPPATEQTSRLMPIQHAPLVQTVDEVKAALTNLTPVNICCLVHPSQSLDSKGVSTSVRRGGGHSTGIIGQYFDGSQWWFDHVNSWWYYYKGGFCRPGNKRDAQFKGAVNRINEQTLQAMLQERDSYALVGVQGLEPIDQEYSRLMA